MYQVSGTSHKSITTMFISFLTLALSKSSAVETIVSSQPVHKLPKFIFLHYTILKYICQFKLNPLPTLLALEFDIHFFFSTTYWTSVRRLINDSMTAYRANVHRIQFNIFTLFCSILCLLEQICMNFFCF